jgi:hypothetical protein
MSKIISPIIFFSISKDGIENFEAIKKYSAKINHHVYSKFIRYVNFNEDFSITESISDKKIALTFNGNSKLNNYSELNKNRQEFLSVFQSLSGDIRNIDNIKYAQENGFELGETQIIILSTIDNTYLTPLVLPLILNFDPFKDKLKFQFLLLYNQDLISNKSNESRLLKNSFFRDIETTNITLKPKVWLLDIINEDKINLKDKSNLQKVTGQFIDILISDSENIDQATKSHGNIENGKPCIYYSFGYSLLKFPIEKINEYLNLYANAIEFAKLKGTFDIKFEAIRIKDEVAKFLKKNGFEDIPERLTKKENADSIFVPFVFKGNQIEQEKEEVLGEQLSEVLLPDTLSKTTTSDFFHKIDETEKKYIDDIQIEFSSHIDDARKREVSNFIEIIGKTQCELIDKSGINYSILFVAVLSNNKSVVESMLNGRYSQDIPTLITIEDQYRGSFIGDEISIIEKELKTESDNSSNKIDLVEKYTVKLADDEANLTKIDVSGNPDNPKISELTASIVNYKKQLSALPSEIENHNQKIKKSKSKIEKVKSDFDLDATKDKFRIKRNEEVEKVLKDTRETEIGAIDNQLVIKYKEKNDSILRRKKFIFYNLIIIPSILFGLMFLIQFFLFYRFDWFDLHILKTSLIVTAILATVYFLINLIKFFKLKKKFEILIGEITDLLSKKSNVFQKYITKKNEFYNNNFSFERDIIALEMMKSIIDSTSKQQGSIEKFKHQIIESEINYQNEKETFDFNDSSFELCVIEKSTIETIYQTNVRSNLFDSENENRLSLCFKDFSTTNKLELLNNIIEKKAREVFDNKIKKENLKTVLLNESPSFGRELNTNAKFNQLKTTSRPLLQTPKENFINLSSDIAFTENIMIGFNDNVYKTYLDNLNLIFNSSIKIDEGNENLFGILSIKSNFPSFLIYDVEENEDLVRNEISNSNKTEYFVNDNAFSYNLLPSSSSRKETDTIEDELIVALAEKLIIYDTKKEKFSHPIIGDLGVKFEDLFGFWNMPLCYDIKEKAKELIKEFWELDKDDSKKYTSDFKKFWIDFPVKIPAKYESRISEYFFSIKGTEKDWNEIKDSFKSKGKIKK